MENTYDPIILLKKAYAEIETTQKTNKTNKLLLTTPDVVFMNKKTFVKNFGDICDKLGRSELELKAFFETELNTTMSIDSNKMLVISGRYFQIGIKTVLTNYIKQYILCSECKSTDTEIIKENRINFIKCKTCYSKKSITL